MRSVGTFEAKNKLSELLDAVERGEEVEITRRGKPVARLVHVEAPRDNDAVAREFDRIVAESAKSGARASVTEILSWRDKGRP